ncbi:uroporphyrinogen-III synthase [Pusillimonas sp. NJUB218]|uniref:uroporphyrinogen-III synthase n=1 Tax=Pusillimonas sp. NJUB218 TaxID=2023230 RepID=UPI000F4B8103|nr:uroporphyrinogen-III synthase [Pusillimonas sp. NJUB218]ROT44227.1 hypothetical protein CHR62_12910 [Pusillimonas sp. NJUB218]
MRGLDSPLVVLTRPEGKNAPLAAVLQAKGLMVFDLPALQIHPAQPDPVGFSALENFDLVVFVSRIALTSYQWQQAQLLGASAMGGKGTAVLGQASARTPLQMSFEPTRSQGHRPKYLAAVGPSTAVALAQFNQGLSARILAPPQGASHDSEGLWQVLQPHLPEIQSALIVRGQAGRDWLGEQLVRAGVQVVRHASYARLPSAWTPEQVLQLAAMADRGQPTIWLLTSVHGVDAIFDQLRRHQLLKVMANARFVAIHDRIAQRLKSQITVCCGADAQPAVTLCATDNASMADALVAVAR